MLVVIPEGQQDQAQNYQLRLVKDPGSYAEANRNLRDEYIMKWMNGQLVQPLKDSHIDPY